MIWRKFLSYLNFFRKQQPDGKRNIYLTMMHSINRISIFLLLFAIIVWLIRHVF